MINPMSRYAVVLVGGRVIFGSLMEYNSEVVEVLDDNGMHHIIERHSVEECVSSEGVADGGDDGGGDDDDDDFDPFDPDGLRITWIMKAKDE